MSLVDILKTFQDEKEIVKDGDRYVEKDKDGISLKGVLQRGLLKQRKEASKHRQGLTFRPSGITYSYCRRIKVAQLAGLVELWDDKPAPRLQLTFDMGHAVHDIIQTYFWNIGLLKGSYKCIKCDKIFHDLISPQACPSGKTTHGRKHLKYKEIMCKHPVLPISGRSDGILVIDGDEHIMDIKSIANRALKTSERQFCFEDLEIQGPKSDHIVQINIYMWLMHIERSHLFYVAKNDHQIKSFAIPYDYEVIRPYISEIEYLVDLASRLKAGERVELPAPCGSDKCKCDEILSKMPG